MTRSHYARPVATQPRPVIPADQPARSPVAQPASGSAGYDEHEDTVHQLRTMCLGVLQGPRAATAQQATVIDVGADYLVELSAHLALLVGVEGCRALVSRAVRLASVDYPFLTDVRPALTPPGRLLGLRKHARHVAPNEALEAVAATLAGVLWLLLNFIGEDLTQRLLGEVWPWLADTRLSQHEPHAQRLTA